MWLDLSLHDLSSNMSRSASCSENNTAYHKRQRVFLRKNNVSKWWNRKLWKKFWTIPQNFLNIEVILFLIALLKTVISFLNCQNNFKGSRGRRMKIYFCQLIGHFPCIDRTICLIYLTIHREVLPAFSEWLYILMYFSFYSSVLGNRMYFIRQIYKSTLLLPPRVN